MTIRHMIIFRTVCENGYNSTKAAEVLHMTQPAVSLAIKELGWIEEDEMMDLTAIAQSSPGAIAVNASILVGYHVAGFPGAMLTVLGTILPPLIIISIISMFYQAFRDNAIVNMAMTGMLCGVAAVICDVVINMAKTIFQNNSRYITVYHLLSAFFLDAMYPLLRSRHRQE